MGGIGVMIWRIAVSLYLLATGVLATFKSTGHLSFVFSNDLFLIIAGIIALLAGIFLLLELFNIKVPIVDILVLIIAIVWVVIVVFGVIAVINAKGDFFWARLQDLGVHVMVCASLLLMSKKFGG